jgi:hypothetical protein
MQNFNEMPGFVPEELPKEEPSAEKEMVIDKEKMLKLNIADASDMRAVYTLIQENGGIQGSQKFYTADEMIDLIGKVFQGTTDIRFITSAYGLRAKVQYFMTLGQK